MPLLLTDEWCAFGVDDSTGEKMEIILFLIHHHRVTSVISSLWQRNHTKLMQCTVKLKDSLQSKHTNNSKVHAPDLLSYVLQKGALEMWLCKHPDGCCPLLKTLCSAEKPSLHQPARLISSRPLCHGLVSPAPCPSHMSSNAGNVIRVQWRAEGILGLAFSGTQTRTATVIVRNTLYYLHL